MEVIRNSEDADIQPRSKPERGRKGFGYYCICMITKWAETGRVLPAKEGRVSAGAVPSGFRTVKTELVSVVSTIAIPKI